MQNGLFWITVNIQQQSKVSMPVLFKAGQGLRGRTSTAPVNWQGPCDNQVPALGTTTHMKQMVTAPLAFAQLAAASLLVLI